MAAPLLRTDRYWQCPNCPAQHVTHEAAPHLPFHPCPGLHGMLAPYVQAGVRCKVEVQVREDYAGAEAGLRYDGEGRPVSAIVTTRDDGTDCAVFPGTACARRKE